MICVFLCGCSCAKTPTATPAPSPSSSSASSIKKAVDVTGEESQFGTPIVTLTMKDGKITELSIDEIYGESTKKKMKDSYQLPESAVAPWSDQIQYLEKYILKNGIFMLVIWLCEGNKWIKHTSCKTVQYDKINLITPERYDEMVEDLTKRHGLNIVRVEVGAVDFLRDMAVLKVYYKPQNEEVNTIDDVIKLSREQWGQKDS